MKDDVWTARQQIVRGIGDSEIGNNRLDVEGRRRGLLGLDDVGQRDLLDGGDPERAVARKTLDKPAAEHPRGAENQDAHSRRVMPSRQSARPPRAVNAHRSLSDLAARVNEHERFRELGGSLRRSSENRKLARVLAPSRPGRACAYPRRSAGGDEHPPLRREDGEGPGRGRPECPPHSLSRERRYVRVTEFCVHHERLLAEHGADGLKQGLPRASRRGARGSRRSSR